MEALFYESCKSKINENHCNCFNGSNYNYQNCCSVQRLCDTIRKAGNVKFQTKIVFLRNTSKARGEEMKKNKAFQFRISPDHEQKTMYVTNMATFLSFGRHSFSKCANSYTKVD
jgi:predicted transglutaminase-like protease